MAEQDVRERIELMDRVEQLEDEVIRLQNNISRNREEIQRLDKLVEKLILNGFVAGEPDVRNHA